MYCLENVIILTILTNPLQERISLVAQQLDVILTFGGAYGYSAGQEAPMALTFTNIPNPCCGLHREFG